MSIAKQIADMSAGRVTEEDVRDWFPTVQEMSLGSGGFVLIGETFPDGQAWSRTTHKEYRNFLTVESMLQAIEKHRDEKKKPVDNRTWGEKVEAAVKEWNKQANEDWVLVGKSIWGGAWMQFARTDEAVTISQNGDGYLAFEGRDWTVKDAVDHNNELVDCLHAEGLTNFKKYKQVD